MRQVWHPYWDWEDYKAGMWAKVERNVEIKMLSLAKDFTGDWIRYGKAMKRAVIEWPITMEHNLTNQSINQKAFVGHCAVCLETGIPEYITRAAWKLLSDNQQYLANKAAQDAINLWRDIYFKKGQQGGLFEWTS